MDIALIRKINAADTLAAMSRQGLTPALTAWERLTEIGFSDVEFGEDRRIYAARLDGVRYTLGEHHASF